MVGRLKWNNIGLIFRKKNLEKIINNILVDSNMFNF